MKDQFLEQIENYLTGSISREELERSAKQAGVTDLDKQISWFKNTLLAIEAEGLKKQLGMLNKKTYLPENVEKGKTVNMWMRNHRVLSIAACMVLLFGLFFILRPSKSNQLYSQYEYVDPGIPILMSETDRYELYDALTYYSEQNYGEAIIRLKSMDYANASYKDTAEFYLAASYLYSGTVDKCIPLFDSVANQTASVFSEKASWLKALSLLKAEKTEDLLLVLEQITSNTEHSFFEEAVSLSEKLNQ
ncbi:MAG: hypothetical protein GY751_25745 [Bacteroidetes bacterium]|nr:hypothetical protein [Bacteroidota bacterium]